MTRWDRLAERRIQAARMKGDLDGLAGEGAPMPDRSGEAHLSAGDAAGMRIMAEAGVVPDEIGLKRELDALRAEFAKADGVARAKLMSHIAEAELRWNVARESRKRFLKD
ncbi:MAG: DUF1992 domain-containing protein [Pseudomonadota bacterium]